MGNFGKKRRFRHRQSGFSLLELLVVMAILTLIIVPLLGTLSVLDHTTTAISSQKAIAERNRYLIEDLRETLASAGTATKNLAGDRLIVKDAVSGKARPAAFLNEDGTVLTVLTTDQTGRAAIIAKTGNMLVLDKAAWNRWEEVHADSYLMAVNAVGPAAILKLTSAPRQATEADIPEDLGTYNLAQAIVLQTAPAGTVLGVDSLTATVADDATIVPITRIVSYSVVDNCIQRNERNAGKSSSPGGPSGPGRYFTALMTPGLTATLEFSYLTPTGRTKTLPADPNTLRGIRVQTRLTDPTTKFTQEDDYDLFVAAWQ